MASSAVLNLAANVAKTVPVSETHFEAGVGFEKDAAAEQAEVAPMGWNSCAVADAGVEVRVQARLPEYRRLFSAALSPCRLRPVFFDVLCPRSRAAFGFDALRLRLGALVPIVWLRPPGFGLAALDLAAFGDVGFPRQFPIEYERRSVGAVQNDIAARAEDEHSSLEVE